MIDSSLAHAGDWTLRWQTEHLAPFLALSTGDEALATYWRTYRRLDELRTLIGFGPDTRTLDVGCGMASVLRCIPGLRTGVDPQAVAYQRRVPWPEGVTLIAASAASLPFPDGHFDVVVCSNALDHMDDPTAALEEMARVVRPGGFLLLICEVDDSGPRVRNAGHPQSFSRAALRAQVEAWSVDLAWEAPFLGVGPYLRGVRVADAVEAGYLLRATSPGSPR